MTHFGTPPVEICLATSLFVFDAQQVVYVCEYAWYMLNACVKPLSRVDSPPLDGFEAGSGLVMSYLFRCTLQLVCPVRGRRPSPRIWFLILQAHFCNEHSFKISK